MFLFFSFSGYDASGGAHDLIGKTIGTTWADLTTLLDANLEAEESDPHFPRRSNLLEYVQVLNIETLEKRTAGIDAKRNDEGVWVVEDFWFFTDDAVPFLEGIPYTPPPPKPKPVPPPKPQPADYIYYKLSAVALVRQFEGGKVAEQKRFAFMCKRPKDKPFIELLDQPCEAIIDMVTKAFLHRHGERLNEVYGRMTWHVQIAGYNSKPWVDYSPNFGEFEALPETQVDALQKSNPTYEEFDVQRPNDGS
jgi:hypothetical protein